MSASDFISFSSVFLMFSHYMVCRLKITEGNDFNCLQNYKEFLQPF